MFFVFLQSDIPTLQSKRKRKKNKKSRSKRHDYGLEINSSESEEFPKKNSGKQESEEREHDIEILNSAPCQFCEDAFSVCKFERSIVKF